MKPAPILTLLFLALLLPATPVAAQIDFSLSGGDEAIPAEIVALEVREVALDGERVTGVLRATIADGWHINSDRPNESYSIPTTLALQPESVQLVRAGFPPHHEREFSFAGGKLAVFEGTIEVPFEAVVPAGVAGVRADFRYQACNDRLCLPPRIASAAVIGGTGAAGSAAGDFMPLTAAPPEGASPALFTNDIAGLFASRGLLLTLAVIFVLGLALNLTPCVYPLIPITLAFFSSQGEGRRSRQVGLSSVYVLGLAATYSALGVFAALSGSLFGAWLQQPAVLIFFALLMIALSASMFGLYEIRVPQFITSRASGRAGYAGALSMGLLAGIVAAPCVGPFVISLITLVAQEGSASFGFLLFFVLALGLGLPYLLLGIFSSAVSAIPRSGAWLVQIKKALGFVLIAMAFYFLRPIVGDDVYHWGVAGSLIIGALFLLLQRSAQKDANAIRIVSALLLLAGGVWFVWPTGSGNGVQWQPFDESTLQAAAASGKPVIIDFYADWCLPCKELDEKTFTDDGVIAESERFIRLKADLTKTADARTRELSERYRVLGVPTIVFLDGRGNETSNRLTGFEPAPAFLERMKRVR